MRPPPHTTGLFETMPSMDDEAVWDLLEMMYALIDAYEAHYADSLQRLRAQRYRELHEHDAQLNLPLDDESEDLF